METMLTNFKPKKMKSSLTKKIVFTIVFIIFAFYTVTVLFP